MLALLEFKIELITLLVYCLVDGDELMFSPLLVLVREDAVDAEELAIDSAVGFDLFTMPHAALRRHLNLIRIIGLLLLLLATVHSRNRLLMCAFNNNWFIKEILQQGSLVG